MKSTKKKYVKPEVEVFIADEVFDDVFADDKDLVIEAFAYETGGH